MGFRYVEPEPPEPQRAVPTWLALGSVLLVALVLLLPIVLPITFAVLTVGERLNDRPTAQAVEALEPEVSTAADAYRDRRREELRARVEALREERTLEWVTERDRAVACEELRAQSVASGMEMSDPPQPCSVPPHQWVRVDIESSEGSPPE